MNLQRMVEASKVTSFGAILAFEPLSNALASMMWDYCNDFRDIENWDVVDSTTLVSSINILDIPIFHRVFGQPRTGF